MHGIDIPGRVDFSVTEAQWLADLHGIERDLKDVVRLCERCMALMRTIPGPQADPNGYLDALWFVGEISFASVVKYGRTFGSGVRGSIPKAWIDALPSSDQAAHQYFKDLRDKFIAHSVNAFEDNQVFAYLFPQTSPAEVKSITVDVGRYVSLSHDDVMRLKALAGALLSLVRAAIASEMSRVLAIARQIPIAELLHRETENRPIPGSDDVAKGRRLR